MKGFPATVEPPRGPWRAKVDALMAQALKAQTAEEVRNLLGEPDEIHRDAGEPTETWDYADPSRPGRTYCFDVSKRGAVVGFMRVSRTLDSPTGEGVAAPVVAQAATPAMASARPSGSPGPVLSTPDEVDAAEAQLGIAFPAGYREFVTRLGEGLLGRFVRIYPPRRILEGSNNVHDWRQRIDRYWFWDAGHDVLSRDQVLRSMIVGDTINGDELIVCPDIPGRLHLLPRDSDEIWAIGNDLPGAITWLLESGKIVEPSTDRTFEPFDSRSFDAH
jgi:hypothetical protein